MLKDLVFVVSGGGNGIGREIVLHLLKNGTKVAALDISQKGLDETMALTENNAMLKLYPLDITNEAKVKETRDQIIADFGNDSSF